MSELLFHDATVVTMNAKRAVLNHTSVAVRDARIVETGAPCAMRGKYANAAVIDCRHKALLPGMVDLHGYLDRKSTRLNSSHIPLSRMPSSA